MVQYSLLNLNQLLDDIAGQGNDGRIESRSRFNFYWRNIHFLGQILPSPKAHHFSISLVANLGYLPFSSEDFARRTKLLKIFTPLFMRGDYILAAGSKIQTTLMTSFKGPVNAKTLVEAITYTLLEHHADLTSLQMEISS